MESSPLVLTMLIVTFMREIKTEVREKHHFDDRAEPRLLTTFWKLWTIKILMQRWKSKVFLVQPSFTGVRFSFQTLPEEIRPVVTEKHDVEYRQTSEKNRFLGACGFRCKKQEDWKLNWSFSLSVRSLIVTLMKDIKTVVTEKHQFDKADESFSVITFGSFGLSRFWCKY